MNIKDNFKGKKVLVRVDFNVPLVGDKITSDKRIVEAMPTIDLLRKQGAKVILCSHLGRPDGERKMEYSLKPVFEYLVKALDTRVIWADDCIGESAFDAVEEMKEGEVVLLENLRFHAGEEANDEEFAKKLASLADVTVNDAFGTSHRKHASNNGVAKFIPSCDGLLMARECEMLTLGNAPRPLVAILGGAKVSDKIELIKNLLDKIDVLLVGGAMSFTFLKALGGTTSNSKVEDDKLDVAKEIVELAKEKNVKLLLPIDFVCATEIKDDVKVRRADSYLIPTGYMGLDIGRKTIKLFAKEIKKAGTVFWNGPMGVFEVKKFSKGTYAIAKAMSKSKARTIVGGGDSASAVINMGFEGKITHISTGGGASLKYIQKH